jgi:predicted PurR-regulated permease PerM
MGKDRRPASRAERFWGGANARGIPLQAIVATVAVVTATYLAGKLLYRLRDVVLLLLVAGFFAVLLSPLVDGLQHRGIRRRGVAVFLVIVLVVLVFALIAAAFGYPLSRGIAHLAHDLPGYVVRAEHGRGWAGHLVRQYHLGAWVRRNESKLIRFGQDLARPALTVGKGAASLLAALATTFVLVVLLLLEGPGLMQGMLNAMSPAHAERFSRLAGEASRSATGYMAGNCLTSLIAGIVVYVTLLILGVPFPLLWALWVALVDFLPMVGGALAGIPTVLFAAAHSLTAGIVTAVVFAVYTQIENHVLNPLVMSKTVRVSPLFVLVSVLAGASIGGWLGGVSGAFVAALLAIPTAAALQAVIRELWQETAPDTPSSPGNGTLPVLQLRAGLQSQLRGQARCTIARHWQPDRQRWRADDQRIRRADGLVTPAAVAEKRQDAAHRFQPCASLVVPTNHPPRRVRQLGVPEHDLLGGGVLVPFIERCQIDRAELPPFHRIKLTVDEPAELLRPRDREPQLDQVKAILDEHPLEVGRILQKPVVFLRLAETQHVLDPGPVVPGPVQQHDLSRCGKVRQEPAQVVIALLVRRRLVERDHPRTTRVQVLSKAPDCPALTRSITALEDDQQPLTGCLHSLL